MSSPSAEDHFRKLIEYAPDAVFVQTDYCFAYLNDAALELFGAQNKAQLLGQPVIERVHPDFREITDDRIQIVNKDRKKVPRIEEVYLKLDGTPIPVEVSVKPITFRDKPGGLVFARDISVRKHYEIEQQERLKRMQKQMEAVVQIATHDAIRSGNFEAALRVITERTANVMDVGRASIWLLDHDGHTLRCIDLFEMKQQKHSSGTTISADDVPRYFEAINASRAINANDAQNDPRTSEFTESYLKPLGITSMLDAAIRISGQAIGVICYEHTGPVRTWYYDEISFAGQMADQVVQLLLNVDGKKASQALTESETRYRQLVEILPVGVIVHSDGKIVFSNHSAAKMFGTGNPESIIGKQAIEFVHPDLRSLVAQRIQKALSETGTAPPLEEKFIDIDGKIIDVEVMATTLTFQGKPAMMTVFSDISERKRAVLIQKMQFNIANAVVTAKNLRELFETVRNELTALIDTTNFFIALFNEENGMLTAPFDIDEKDNVPVWPAAKSLTGYVIQQQRSMLLSKSDISQLAESGIIDFIGSRAEVWIGVPLKTDKTIIGALVVQHYNNPEAYDKNSVELLELIANQLSIYIERKNAELNALKLSKAVTQNPASIVITDTKGAIEYVNPKFTEITGYSLEETIGKNPRILQSGVHPKAFYKNLWGTITSGKDWHGEFRNKKKNGELYWENAIISPIIDEAGDITHFVAVKEDITLRKEAVEALREKESQLKVILESTADGILAIDEKGKVVKTNKRFAELWRIPQELLDIGDDNALLDYVLNQLTDPDKFIQKVRMLYQSRDEDLDLIHFKDGRTFERFSAPMVINESSLGRVWSFRDITARKRAEEEVASHRNRLRQLVSEISKTEEKERSNLAIALHDQIGQPIGMAKIKLGQIQKNEIPENMIKQFGEIEDLITQAIKESRVLTYDLSPPVLHQMGMIKAISWRLDQISETYKIKTGLIEENPQIKLQPDLEILIYRSVNELLTNVVKHSSANEIRVQIKDDEEHIEIIVADNGTGFHTANMETELIKGNKYGLLSIKERIEYLGGLMEIESSTGKGTKIRMVIPVNQP